jgi:hypothetical protein
MSKTISLRMLPMLSIFTSPIQKWVVFCFIGSSVIMSPVDPTLIGVLFPANVVLCSRLSPEDSVELPVLNQASNRCVPKVSCAEGLAAAPLLQTEGRFVNCKRPIPELKRKILTNPETIERTAYKYFELRSMSDEQ